jgi:hypothetical protein
MQADFLRLQQIYRLDLHCLDVFDGAASPRRQKLALLIDICYKKLFLQTSNCLQKQLFI